MPLDERQFAAAADRTLQTLLDAVEEALPDTDGDLRDGILTLEVAGVGTFIVNRHLPNREIWLSSPRSGAWHFAWSEGAGAWVSTRGEERLEAVLAADLGVALSAA